MKHIILLSMLCLITQPLATAQCNEGLNLGTVVIPTHGNASNSGNFYDVSAWVEAAAWVDSLNLDYRQKYISWTDVVDTIAGGVPQYNAYYSFENSLTPISGNSNMHVVYPLIKVEMANSLLPSPAGFTPSVSEYDSTFFSDTAFVNQNYLAIKHILQNIDNVKWISVGNEMDTYFKNSYWGTGRLTRYGAFLDTVRNRMNADGFSNVKLGSVVAFHNLAWVGNYDIIDSIRPHVDFVGYTFYYTSLASPYDTCWGDPATVTSWLNIAKTKVGSKKMMITETCMADGGGVSQNCGSPSKQLAYADTLLNWYKTDTSKIEGMTWFTLVDPYMGWLTPATLWNTCGIIDSNGVSIQAAGAVWQHNCSLIGLPSISENSGFSIYPNPFNSTTTLHTNQLLTNATITIYNLHGQMVNQLKNISGNTITLQRNNLLNGLYYIEIDQKGISFIANKLIIAD